MNDGTQAFWMNYMKQNQKMLYSLVLLLVSLAWVFSDSLTSRDRIVQDGSRMARLLANNLPLMHLNKVEWNDELASQALNNYLEALDFEKVFFMAEDIAAFRDTAGALHEQVRRGDLAFAHTVYAVFKERVADRVAFANSLLDEPFNFDVDETYEWKRRDATWADGQEAWDDLWRRRIKHQYLSRLINDSGEDADDEIIDPDAASRRSHSDEVNAQLTPEAFVRRSLTRYETVIKDNDEAWVVERYLTAFARAFDPHTDFMSPSNMEDFEINMKLSLQGIGAMLSSEEGTAKVERLIPGGPAEQDGRLQPGDKIIAVAQGEDDPVDVLHWPLYRTVRLIRGEKGTQVVLSIIPASDPSGTSIRYIDLIRDEVKLEEKAAKGELRTLTGENGDVTAFGVITLPDFYSDFKGGQDGEFRSSTRDVERVLNELLSQGAEGIILDLRNNGGGSLNEAVELTGLFIKPGPVVQMRDRRRIRPLFARNPEVVYDGPLVVLVNRLSASASEIVAGALQDYSRAIIVGDSRTHGKGTVQTLTGLSSANPQLGSVKVTTASFYRIAGGSTQIKGVEPDIVIPSFMETLEVGEDRLPNALPYSTINRLEYEPVQDLSGLIALLRVKSEERRSSDLRFQSYLDLLNRSRDRQQSSTISLRMEDRQRLVAKERELRKQIEFNDPDTGKRDDLILGEALAILRDMTTMKTMSAMNTGAR